MAERGLVVTLISIFIIFLGGLAILKINREAFPNVNLDVVQVSVYQPGASPQDIERLIIIPIEQEIKSLSGIDKMTSVSFPGSARINLELDPHATNRDRITNEVQLAIDRARLPADLPEDPFVLEIDARVFPVIQLAIGAPWDDLRIKQLGTKIEDDLLRIEGVGRVQIQGERKAEISVTVKPEKLKQHRVTVGQIADVLSKWNINASGGAIDTSDGQKIVRIVGEYQNVDDVANLVLRANEFEQGLLLRDVADVTANLEKASVYQDVSGKPALHMIVMKQSDADIIDTVDRVKKYLASVPEKYGKDIEIDTFDDFSRIASLRLGVLTNNGIVGAFLVLVTLVIFLRPSVAVSTTLGLPIVFLLGLFILYVMGITLNLISMMGFIMVLGMLVDDAIIVGENIAYHMEQGMQTSDAAVLGARELMGPVTSTILTTVVAFLPMMFLSGIIGKFIIAIPIVVMLLLSLSWLESFMLLPNHVAHLTHPKKTPPERKWLLWLEEKYAGFLAITLKHHWLMVILSILLLAGSAVLAKTQMRFQLFPPVGIEQYIVRVTSHPGINLEDMRETMRTIDKDIRDYVKPDYLEATLITTGQTAKDNGDPNVQKGSRFGQIRVIYTPAVTRSEHNALHDMYQIKELLNKKYSQLEFAFEQIQPGPPTGRALQVEIIGDQYEDGKIVAEGLMKYLHSIKGITTLESDLLPGDDELHITFNKALAAYAGIDLATASNHVRAAVDGLRVTTTRWGTEEVDVTIRFPENSYQQQIEQLNNIQVPNSRGGMVTLDKVATFSREVGFTNIRHKDGQRVINVMANIDSSVITSRELNKKVELDQDKWVPDDYAKKVHIKYGGENEKNEESMQDLLVAFSFSLVAIFFILAIQFNNLGYPVAVMLAIPFGAIGVVLSFYFHSVIGTWAGHIFGFESRFSDLPLSFMSTLGMVALTGVVVNSSLILLVFIQRNLQEGYNRVEAILIAGRRRLRAVLLTAVTTIVGLLPTAYGWGGLDPFVSTMALALSWGLIFATLITLVMIPALFMAGADIFSRKQTTR